MLTLSVTRPLPTRGLIFDVPSVSVCACMLFVVFTIHLVGSRCHRCCGPSFCDRKRHLPLRDRSWLRENMERLKWLLCVCVCIYLNSCFSLLPCTQTPTAAASAVNAWVTVPASRAAARRKTAVDATQVTLHCLISQSIRCALNVPVCAQNPEPSRTMLLCRES